MLQIPWRSTRSAPAAAASQIRSSANSTFVSTSGSGSGSGTSGGDEHGTPPAEEQDAATMGQEGDQLTYRFRLPPELYQ
jgi:hypothetical protein